MDNLKAEISKLKLSLRTPEQVRTLLLRQREADIEAFVTAGQNCASDYGLWSSKHFVEWLRKQPLVDVAADNSKVS